MSFTVHNDAMGKNKLSDKKFNCTFVKRKKR